MGHLVGGPQTNITGIVFRGGGVVSCSDTFSKVIEDSAIHWTEHIRLPISVL